MTFTATPSQTAALLGWAPFVEIDLDFTRPGGAFGIEHLGGSFQTSGEASTFLLDSVQAGWTLTNISVWD
jgi:hypothetical protein